MTDDPTRLSQLRDAGRELGLIDLDLCLLAQDSVPVGVAMNELVRKYPAAFPKPFDARTASQGEVDAGLRRMAREGDPVTRRSRQIAEMMKQAGDVRKMPEADYKALCRKMGLP